MQLCSLLKNVAAYQSVIDENRVSASGKAGRKIHNGIEAADRVVVVVRAVASAVAFIGQVGSMERPVKDDEIQI